MPVGKLEARYVRRTKQTAIGYLSSHTGCDKACRFCWLTSTGQTSLIPTTFEELEMQARQVIKHYETQPEAEYINWNFMARGEPLASSLILNEWEKVQTMLWKVTPDHLGTAFKISTIMPNDIMWPFQHKVFGDFVDPYYSIYSTDEQWRKRWLPKAMDHRQALLMLADWQHRTGRRVTIHFPMIHNENDSIENIESIIDAVKSSGLTNVGYNLVRYNPPNNKSRESDTEVLDRNFQMLLSAFPKSQIVTRVGPDIYASCGQFIS